MKNESVQFLDDAAERLLRGASGFRFIKDTAGRVVSASDEAEAYFGTTRGKTFYELVSKELAAWVERLDITATLNQTAAVDVYPFRLDFGAHPELYRFTSEPLINGDESAGVFVLIEPAVDADALAVELSRVRSKFSALNEVMAHNSFVVLLWEDSKLSYVSPNMSRYGFTYSRFKTLDDWRAVVHPEDLPAFDRKRAEIFGGEPDLSSDFWDEYRIVTPEGETRWIHERLNVLPSSSVVLVRSMLLDTTARVTRQSRSDSLAADPISGKSIDELNLTDIVSIDFLQEMNDKVADALGVSACIVDTGGAPLTKKKNACPLCMMVQSTKRGASSCRMSDANLCLSAQERGDIVFGPCESSGLWTAAAPIIVGGKHMANWMVGQIRTESVKEENIRSYARHIGLDEQKITAVFNSMKLYSGDETDKMVSSLWPYLQEIGELAYRNYLLMYESEQMVKSQETISRSSGALSLLSDVYSLLFNAPEQSALGEVPQKALSVICAYYGFSSAYMFTQESLSCSWSGESDLADNAPLDKLSVSNVNDLVSLCGGSSRTAQLNSSTLPEFWRGVFGDGKSLVICAADPDTLSPIVFVKNRQPLSDEDIASLYYPAAAIVGYMMRQRSEMRVSESLEVFRLVISNLRDSIYAVREDNYELVFASPRIKLKSKDSCYAGFGKNSPCSYCRMAKLKSEPMGASVSFETDEYAEGYIHFVQMTRIPWLDGGTVILVSIRDVTDLRQKEKNLLYLTTHDSAIGIPNFSCFEAKLEEMRKNECFVIAVDVDNAALIQNAYGLAYGDALLREIAAFMRDASGETVYLFAPGTLSLILPGSQERFDAFVLKLNERFHLPWRILDKTCPATYSSGAVKLPEFAGNTRDISGNLTVARNRSIDRRRNSLYVLSETLQGSIAKQLDLANDLHRAVIEGCGEFIAHYQPIFNIAYNEISRFEALLRWQHPTRGLIMPGEFISIAEDTGLLIPITQHLLRLTSAQFQKWRTEYDPGLAIHVNFSGGMMREKDSVTFVESALQESGLPAANLIVEVNESATIYDHANIYKQLGEYLRRGVGVAVDNFGTGYSSLSTLRDMPFGTIKVDKNFVQRCTESEYDRALVSFAVRIAHMADKSVVCEGVETEAQLAAVRSLGADYAQGYYFAKPLSPEDAEKMLYRLS